MLGARRFCSQARHWLTQPTKQRRGRERGDHSSTCVRTSSELHSTSASSTSSVTKLYSRYVAMRPCCSHATSVAMRCDERADRQVEPVPDAIADRDAVARRAVERRRQLALHGEERLEDLADRLAEAFRRVLHARVAAARSRNPRRAPRRTRP